MVPIILEKQLVPETLEFAIHHFLKVDEYRYKKRIYKIDDY